MQSPCHCLRILVCLTSLSFAQARELGAVLEDSQTYQSIPLAVTPARGNLPRRIDLSASFPTPGDQGNQGSCVGWAVAYALKSYQEKVERKWPGTGPTQTFSPAFLYNQIKLEGGGAHISDALDFLIRSGVVTLKDFPYDPGDDSRMPSSTMLSAGRAYSIAAWRRVDLAQMSDTKSHLASGFPVVIGMKVSASFSRHRGNETYTYDPEEEDDGAHAMCVIAYDEERRAVKLINSWGDSWGDQGYVWISYDTYLAKVREAYVTQDIVVNRPDEEGDEVEEIEEIEPHVTPESPWVFADSNKRQLLPAELRVCSSYQLWRARNEIYARHGYRFASPVGQQYAKSLGQHYHPVTSDSDQIEAEFNPVEQYNVALIVAFEQGRPDQIGPLPKSYWIFPDSAARRLTVAEIQRLSPEQRWRARNEIYARNGYIFQSDRGKTLCRSIGHLYRPVSNDMEVIDKRMNKMEHINVALIQKLE